MAMETRRPTSACQRYSGQCEVREPGSRRSSMLALILVKYGPRTFQMRSANLPVLHIDFVYASRRRQGYLSCFLPPTYPLQSNARNSENRYVLCFRKRHPFGYQHIREGRANLRWVSQNQLPRSKTDPPRQRCNSRPLVNCVDSQISHDQ
jgi:hypothetical protein